MNHGISWMIGGMDRGVWIGLHNGVWIGVWIVGYGSRVGPGPWSIPCILTCFIHFASCRFPKMRGTQVPRVLHGSAGASGLSTSPRPRRCRAHVTRRRDLTPPWQVGVALLEGESMVNIWIIYGQYTQDQMDFKQNGDSNMMTYEKWPILISW